MKRILIASLALQKPAAARVAYLLHACYCCVVEPAVGTLVRLYALLTIKLQYTWDNSPVSRSPGCSWDEQQLLAPPW
jgi:hypothetical protein